MAIKTVSQATEDLLAGAIAQMAGVVESKYTPESWELFADAKALFDAAVVNPVREEYLLAVLDKVQADSALLVEVPDERTWEEISIDTIGGIINPFEGDATPEVYYGSEFDYDGDGQSVKLTVNGVAKFWINHPDAEPGDLVQFKFHSAKGWADNMVTQPNGTWAWQGHAEGWNVRSLYITDTQTWTGIEMIGYGEADMYIDEIVVIKNAASLGFVYDGVNTMKPAFVDPTFESSSAAGVAKGENFITGGNTPELNTDPAFAYESNQSMKLTVPATGNAGFTINVSAYGGTVPNANEITKVLKFKLYSPVAITNWPAIEYRMVDSSGWGDMTGGFGDQAIHKGSFVQGWNDVYIPINGNGEINIWFATAAFGANTSYYIDDVEIVEMGTPATRGLHFTSFAITKVYDDDSDEPQLIFEGRAAYAESQPEFWANKAYNKRMVVVPAGAPLIDAATDTLIGDVATMMAGADIDEADYTVESWAPFAEAVALFEGILVDPIRNEYALAVIDRLQTAYAALEETTEPPVVEVSGFVATVDGDDITGTVTLDGVPASAAISYRIYSVDATNKVSLIEYTDFTDSLTYTFEDMPVGRYRLAILADIDGVRVQLTSLFVSVEPAVPVSISALNVAVDETTVNADVTLAGEYTDASAMFRIYSFDTATNTVGAIIDSTEYSADLADSFEGLAAGVYRVSVIVNADGKTLTATSVLVYVAEDVTITGLTAVADGDAVNAELILDGTPADTLVSFRIHSWDSEAGNVDTLVEASAYSSDLTYSFEGLAAGTYRVSITGFINGARVNYTSLLVVV